MKKPQPRTAFADEADEMEHILDWVCWAQAEHEAERDYPSFVKVHEDEGEDYATLGELADMFKSFVQRGMMVLEYDEGGDYWRLKQVPNVNWPAKGNA